MEAIGQQSFEDLRDAGYSLLPSQVVFHLNYAQIHFASVAAFVAGWRSS